MPRHNPRQVRAFDNRDDRGEIRRLLCFLPPLERVRFDAWCCAKAAVPGWGERPKVMRKTWDLARQARWDSSADERLTLEVWLDLWTLANQYAFDLDVALQRLVRVVRRT